MSNLENIHWQCLKTPFLQRAAKLGLQALYVYGISVHPSVCPPARPSVRHTPVLCQNEGTQRDAVFTFR